MVGKNRQANQKETKSRTANSAWLACKLTMNETEGIICPQPWIQSLKLHSSFLPPFRAVVLCPYAESREVLQYLIVKYLMLCVYLFHNPFLANEFLL